MEGMAEMSVKVDSTSRWEDEMRCGSNERGGTIQDVCNYSTTPRQYRSSFYLSTNVVNEEEPDQQQTIKQHKHQQKQQKNQFGERLTYLLDVFSACQLDISSPAMSDL